MIHVEPMHKQNNINIDHISFSDSKSLMQIRGQQRQLFLGVSEHPQAASFSARMGLCLEAQS